MTYQKSIWNDSPSMKSYTLSNFRQLPQIQQLSEEKQFEMEVVGNVLPFKYSKLHNTIAIILKVPRK